MGGGADLGKKRRKMMRGRVGRGDFSL